jgi:hypothetical protein
MRMLIEFAVFMAVFYVGVAIGERREQREYDAQYAADMAEHERLTRQVFEESALEHDRLTRQLERVRREHLADLARREP